MESQRIRFEVDIQRVIEVLAKQIYQSPLALLRENTQNAFDAILMRRHRGDVFDPMIEITLDPTSVSIRDNGIGMTLADLTSHFWRAGASGKNNADARAAGVVGTFGIGAMANFGIAEDLRVETESAVTGERTSSYAQRATLSASEDCIELEGLVQTGTPGTLVIARFPPSSPVDPVQARNYIAEFVAFLDVPVTLNGEVLSGHSIEETVSRPVGGRLVLQDRGNLGSSTVANVELVLTNNAELWVALSEVVYGGRPLAGNLVLRSGQGSLRSFRSGFGLATTAISSFYSFGGAADLLDLQPTAGREALSTESAQLLQSVVSEVDDFVSVRLSTEVEVDSSTQFMAWAASRGRYDLCGRLRMRLEPGNRDIELSEIARLTETKPMTVYGGNDPTIIAAYASDDSPLLVFATRHPRQQCETGYLQQFCKVEAVSDQPRLLQEKPRLTWNLAESALAFRIGTILSADYFLDASIAFGTISHSLPVLVRQQGERTEIVLDPAGATIALVLGLYESDPSSFAGMVKDFVRNIIFPRIADLVPSSTRQGAEAFLKTIQRSRDIFEYEGSDLDSLTSIWEDYLEGRLTMMEASERSAAFVGQSIQFVDTSVARSVAEVVPDVVANEEALAGDHDGDELSAVPPILRTEISSDAKLLTIGEDDPPLRGYRCFLALSDRVRLEKGDFFLQPHKTSVAWGGQKVMLIFQHHSGRFGLYYDIQTPGLVAETTGGDSFPTCTIVLNDRIFVPIPDTIRPSFMPSAGERKRLEVKCDIIYIDTDKPH